MLIEFYPVSKDVEDIVPSPKPAKNYIPQWYKDAENVNSVSFDKSRQIVSSIKQCLPFIDAMTHGYIQESWCDIFIEFDGDNVSYNYSSSPIPLRLREYPSVSVDDSFYEAEFIWQTPWMPKVPKGYSVLFTHPFNNITLPFYSLSGIVDADSFYHSSSGNYPFYVKKGFSGLIPAGTPLFQMIPIKRENWKGKTIKFNEVETKKRNNMVNKVFINAYRNYFWTKKYFE